MTPYYDHKGITIYNNDCMKIMREMPDKSVDLCLTDPPYGLNKKMNGGTWGLKYNISDMMDWDYFPSEEVFKEIFRISKNQIIWGGNYFNLPPSRCFLSWNKPYFPTLSDFELAWTSFDKLCKKFEANRISNKSHPTEKPIELMKWCISNYSKETDTIFDPFLGSGTTLVAAKQLGRKAIGVEISEKYCAIAKDRLAQEVLL